jgi:hypothetical protein
MRLSPCSLREKEKRVLFLIEYDRSRGLLTTFRAFDDDARRDADDARLELELSLSRRKIEREVVLLEAATEDDLRRTHRRYFEGLAELAQANTDPQQTGDKASHPK